MPTDSVIAVLLKIGIVIALVLLNGFFVAAEFAIVLRSAEPAPIAQHMHIDAIAAGCAFVNAAGN